MCLGFSGWSSYWTSCGTCIAAWTNWDPQGQTQQKHWGDAEGAGTCGTCGNQWGYTSGIPGGTCTARARDPAWHVTWYHRKVPRRAWGGRPGFATAQVWQLCTSQCASWDQNQLEHAQKRGYAIRSTDWIQHGQFPAHGKDVGRKQQGYPVKKTRC